MTKEKRTKNKRRASSILVAAEFYGLTEKDLNDRAKLDEVYIRWQADLALAKLKKRPWEERNANAQITVSKKQTSAL